MKKVTDLKKIRTSFSGQEYLEQAILKDGPRSRATAVFFRNKHKTKEEYIISLKISLNSKDKYGNITEKPYKTITLSEEQIDLLIKYISDNYSALAAGENTYISVKDDNIAPLLSQINSLGLTSKDLVEKMYGSGLLTENLAVAIAAAERAKAILEFEREISNSHSESYWQDWFTRQKWILGSEYLKIIIERDIDTKHIADYLMKTVDGFLDVVEIKKSDIKFWTNKDSHGNYCPTAEVTSAIMQCLNYLHLIEIQANNISFSKRVENATVIRPQCLLVIGRSNNWDDEQRNALRILNSAYNQINIITYDQLLDRAKNLIGIEDVVEINDEILPF